MSLLFLVNSGSSSVLPRPSQARGGRGGCSGRWKGFPLSRRGGVVPQRKGRERAWPLPQQRHPRRDSPQPDRHWYGCKWWRRSSSRSSLRCCDGARWCRICHQQEGGRRCLRQVSWLARVGQVEVDMTRERVNHNRPLWREIYHLLKLVLFKYRIAFSKAIWPVDAPDAIGQIVLSILVLSTVPDQCQLFYYFYRLNSSDLLEDTVEWICF